MADVPKDLQRIESTLAAIDPGQSERYFGVELMRQSLQRRRDQLVTEAYGSLEPLFEDGERSLLELSMERLLSLLSHEDEDQDLLQEVADLGPRVTTHVYDLAKVLAEADATASFRWHSRNLDRAAHLNTSDALQLREVLREVETASRELVFTGRLVGGSLVRGTFELELDDAGSEKTVIAGRVDEAALDDLERLFGNWVTAQVDVRESRLRSGETRESHLLRQLAT